MNHPATTREALIADALGDLTRLLDQLETLVPALEQSGRALTQTQADLGTRLGDFQRSMIGFTENAKAMTAKHVAYQAAEAARHSREEQLRMMSEAARTMFRNELGAVLQRLSGSLHPVVQRLDRPWEHWLTHAATAAVSALVSATLAIWLRTS